MYRLHSTCRACGSSDLKEVFSFDKAMPLANDFALPDQARHGFVPVRVMFCPHCTLAQLGETVDPAILYKNYLYVTSTSQTMQRHFDRLCKDLVSENGKGSLLEIGANDGAFCEFAHERGFTGVVGIDPAENLTGSKDLKEVCMVTGFFSQKLALHLPKSFDTIVARHCFCHQEWKPFLEALQIVSHAKTLVAIEVPWVVDLIKRTEFDSIYSEHTSYLSLKAVQACLKGSLFHIHAVNRYGIHGGSLLVMLRRNDSGIIPHLSADEFLAEESVTEQDWLDFGVKVKEKIAQLKEVVLNVKHGQIVSAFGASAKASVLINACGFTKKDIAFVTDNSPLKPGRLIPGTDIPIIEESQMLAEHPDYAIMTCWNFRSEVIEKNKRWSDRGGKWIIPSPNVEIV